VTAGVEAAPCDVNFGLRMDPRGAESVAMYVSGRCIRPPVSGHGPLFPALGRFSENHPRKQAAGGHTHDGSHVNGTGRENAALTRCRETTAHVADIRSRVPTQYMCRSASSRNKQG
jgi:hypothetical protein